MQVYRDLTPPTAVSHAISAAFTSASSQNLIVVRSNKLLQIFTYVAHESADASNSDHDIPDASDNFTSDIAIEQTFTRIQDKLVLVAEYNLNGRLSGIARVRPVGSKVDYILISFEYAKLSLIAWDPVENIVTTVSLHYYEKDPALITDAKSFLRTDPAAGCACLSFANDVFAFLPFKQDDYDGILSSNTPRENADAPFYPSFVVSAVRLHSEILNVIDAAFLYEYRDSTLAILYQPNRTSTGFIPLFKDTVSLIVVTLDLQQRTSTSILDIKGLPYDTVSIVPLPSPIGGALLLGDNGLVHVDSGGRTIGVAVNPAAFETSSFEFSDRSFLELKLEGAKAIYFHDNYVYLVLSSGELYLIDFILEGRSVLSIEIHEIESENKFLFGSASCIEIFQKRIFVGSLDSDSVLLAWRKEGASTDTGTRQILSKDYNDEDEDLYATAETDNLYNSEHSDDAYKNYHFIPQDTLVNYGPFANITIGSVLQPHEHSDPTSRLEIVAARSGSASGLSVFRRSITPSVLARFSFPECVALWTVRAKNRITQTTDAAEVDKFLFVSKADETTVYDISDQFEEIRGSEFDNRIASLAVESILDGTRIVQICSSEIRVYDYDMQVAQMIPIEDEDAESDDEADELTVSYASFSNEAVLIVLQDGRSKLYVGDKDSLELGEVSLFSSTTFSAACIATVTKFFFSNEHRKRKRNDTVPDISLIEVAVMVTSLGELQIYDLSLQKLVYSVSHADLLPPVIQLSPSRPVLNRRKSSAGIIPREPPPEKPNRIVEVLYTSLGDSVTKQDYLIFRTENNDIAIYQPYVHASVLRFRKVVQNVVTHVKSTSETKNSKCMISLANVNEHAAVFLNLPTKSYWIMKTAQSMPHLVPFGGQPIRSLARFDSMTIGRGFIYVSNVGIVRICQLSDVFSNGGPWPACKIDLEDDVHSVAFHQARGMYVASTSKTITFHGRQEKLDPGEKEEDEEEEEEEEEKDILFPALVEQGSLVLLSPKSWIPVDSYEFGFNEVACVVKSVRLQLSEHSSARREYMAVGTGVYNGEDLPAKGFVYIFEIISVVPEPGKPEHNHKLKLIVKEDVRGVVSSLCDVNGYLLAAQGPKVMVRALREDNSFLPVAFMDMNLLVSEAKSVKNMILMGDVAKSVWFVGFSEEPYKMQLFGKDLQKVEVMAADFVVDGETMHFVVADAQHKLRILQYDPENPRSSSGQRLILKSEFYTGLDIESIVMVPKAEAGEGSTDRYMCIGGTRSGNLVSIIPVSELEYRRLVVVQQQMADKLEHVAGLNPRMYRSLYTSTDMSGAASRAVLDGNLILQFASFGLERQLDVVEHVGKGTESEIWEYLLELDSSLDYM
ncbi:CPSF A subunit region-domain-containing protein [Lipomyces arxii]|uniref:CPSF A subunit region-domain-containing protein n=1 Tax=Lipomyces arxii TaxID=56418 RepID=UPI0034CEF62C